MDASVLMIVLGGVVALAVALLGFWVLTNLGFGPDNDPAARDDAEE